MTVNIGSEELISIKRVLKSPKRLRQHLTHRTLVHQCGKTWSSVELNCWLQWVHLGFVTTEVKTLFARWALTEATLPLGFDIQCHFIHNPWVADMSEWVSEWGRIQTSSATSNWPSGKTAPLWEVRSKELEVGRRPSFSIFRSCSVVALFFFDRVQFPPDCRVSGACVCVQSIVIGDLVSNWVRDKRQPCRFVVFPHIRRPLAADMVSAFCPRISWIFPNWITLRPVL